MPKIGLGRGLDALIPPKPAPVASDASPETRAALNEIAIADAQANPHQPRAHFSEAELNELAASIREHGIIQPIVVTRSIDKGGAPFTIIAGERRWRASKLAGLKRIPVVVKDATPQQLMELALIENIQRADLSPLEEARAYQALADEHTLTHDEVAKRVGKSRSAITNTLRLLELPEKVQAMILEGKLSEGHARTVLMLKNTVDRVVLAEEISAKGLTVRAAEELARRMSAPPKLEAAPSEAPKPDRELRKVEDRLRSALGTKVSIAQSRKGGKITVEYYSDEELKAVVSKMLREG